MIKTLTSKRIYQNKWMELFEDTVERPSGAHGLFSVVNKIDFAVIVAIRNGKIQLVEQYRYPVKEHSIDVTSFSDR